MKNSKAVVLSGFQRGGTGIVWNILQSHPQLCSPILETGEVLFGAHMRRAPTRILKRIFTEKHLIDTPVIGNILFSIADLWLYGAKMRNLNHHQNGTKSDGVLYTRDEIKKCALCMKSVNEDIYLNDIFNKYYKESYYIGLMRNGYALCNGWMRRGYSAEQVGKVYNTIGKYMIETSEKNPNFTIVKFEDAIDNPFGIAEDLFRFANLEPVVLEKLRIKATKRISDSGAHEVKFGSEESKYWFDSKQIYNLLDKNINSTQIHLLSEEDRVTFEGEAKDVLEYFQYS